MVLKKLFAAPCLLLAAAAVYSLFGCATTGNTPPEWITGGIDAVYPRSQFIAQEGRGKTRKDGETNALAALSYYFITEVETSAQSSQSLSTGTGTGVRSSANVNTATFVKSNTSLFAVRYSAPYYDARTKEYSVIAYF